MRIVFAGRSIGKACLFAAGLVIPSVVAAQEPRDTNRLIVIFKQGLGVTAGGQFAALLGGGLRHGSLAIGGHLATDLGEDLDLAIVAGRAWRSAPLQPSLSVGLAYILETRLISGECGFLIGDCHYNSRDVVGLSLAADAFVSRVFGFGIAADLNRLHPYFAGAVVVRIDRR